jgi:hypothetical protein
MNIPEILDIHITHNCNLTCESCSDFTNNGLSKMLSLEEAEDWMSLWNQRITPKNFLILGGEPTLHKDLEKFLYLSRKMWPKSNLILITNGFFIHLHENLWKSLKDNNIILSFSFHDSSKEYMQRISKNIMLIKKWQKDHGIIVSFNKEYEKWNTIYKGYGPNILPFEDNDPKLSWDNCYMNGKCFQLHEGKIWKCPPITYLPLQKEKYGNLLSHKWDPYLKYKPLEPTCSDEDIIEFFNRQAESVCGMCPSKAIIKNQVTKSPLMSIDETEEYFSTLEKLT